MPDQTRRCPTRPDDARPDQTMPDDDQSWNPHDRDHGQIATRHRAARGGQGRRLPPLLLSRRAGGLHGAWASSSRSPVCEEPVSRRPSAVAPARMAQCFQHQLGHRVQSAMSPAVHSGSARSSCRRCPCPDRGRSPRVAHARPPTVPALRRPATGTGTARPADLDTPMDTRSSPTSLTSCTPSRVRVDMLCRTASRTSLGTDHCCRLASMSTDCSTLFLLDSYGQKLCRRPRTRRTTGRRPDLHPCRRHPGDRTRAHGATASAAVRAVERRRSAYWSDV